MENDVKDPMFSISRVFDDVNKMIQGRVCMYVHTRTRAHTHTHTKSHMHIHAYAHAHMETHMGTHMCIHTYTHTFACLSHMIHMDVNYIYYCSLYLLLVCMCLKFGLAE